VSFERLEEASSNAAPAKRGRDAHVGDIAETVRIRRFLDNERTLRFGSDVICVSIVRVYTLDKNAKRAHDVC
jgi:hypothetical protein